MQPIDLITSVIAFLFTLTIFSYVLSDNPVFRVAVHIFIGVSAGYAVAIIVHQVLVPRMVVPLIKGSMAERMLLIFPLLLGLSLLFKVSRQTARLGSVAMAFLVGTGAAVAITGAVTGTLFPQVSSVVDQFDIGQAGGLGAVAEQLTYAAIGLLGAIVTLVYFQFGVRASRDDQTSGRRNLIMRILAYLGQIFVAITFGALFAGVFAAALTALIERMNFLINFFSSF